MNRVFWSPLVFFSKKMSTPRSEGRKFTIYMDHALFRVSLPWSSRQQCHLAYISEFNISFLHLPGSDNAVADALSWPFPVSPPTNPPFPASLLTSPPLQASPPTSLPFPASPTASLPFPASLSTSPLFPASSATYPPFPASPLFLLHERGTPIPP